MFLLFNFSSFTGLVVLMNTNPYFTKLDFKADDFSENIANYNLVNFTIPIIIVFVFFVYLTIKFKINKIIILLTYVVFFFSIARINRVINGYIFANNYKTILVYIIILALIGLFVLFFRKKEALLSLYKQNENIP